jgi:hypothetical protein
MTHMQHIKAVVDHSLDLDRYCGQSLIVEENDHVRLDRPVDAISIHDWIIRDWKKALVTAIVLLAYFIFYLYFR